MIKPAIAFLSGCLLVAWLPQLLSPYWLLTLIPLMIIVWRRSQWTVMWFVVAVVWASFQAQLRIDDQLDLTLERQDIPRLKRLTVSGVFEIGMYEYDSALAIMNIEDAANLFRIPGKVTGLRLQLDDVYQAPRITRELLQTLPAEYRAADWTYQHANFFRALKTEKTVMFVILMLIVAVAAFNIVSTLVMMVTDKYADIAILRTLGMSPRGIMGIFMVQGIVIGLIGTILGVIGGVILALNVSNIIAWIETILGYQFLPAEVYYISDLPSDLHWNDVTVIGITAFVLSILSTIYPSWRAAQVKPAEALRYD